MLGIKLLEAVEVLIRAIVHKMHKVNNTMQINMTNTRRRSEVSFRMLTFISYFSLLLFLVQRCVAHLPGSFEPGCFILVSNT